MLSIDLHEQGACSNPRCGNSVNLFYGGMVVIDASSEQKLLFCSVRCLSTFITLFNERARINTITRSRNLLRELGYK